jgi:2-keto-4-pentenoate hydratase/2-oxohepta-3-ene-1,7-dioic acid hydratase in catechol pathway
MLSRYVRLLNDLRWFRAKGSDGFGPGQTQAVAKGDVIEVEIEGIGTLRNQVG